LAIKLGQLLSTRRDLIPPEVLSQLVLLQDQVKPFDAQVAKQRIQESLKADVNTYLHVLMSNLCCCFNCPSPYRGFA
jgi:predicted unusual protein kinase regulating ubiquinone biosynthesis (AarF/ABC1/UbiB family)